MSEKVLLCDISNGAYITIAVTNSGERPETINRYSCATYNDFIEALSNVLSENGHPHLKGAAFSMSGWEVDGYLDLIHYGFKISIDNLKSMLNADHISIMNNFVAKALAIPKLMPHDYVNLSGAQDNGYPVIGILGPTMGFGGALLTRDKAGFWSASHCEGGHADLAPTNEIEIEILKLLIKKYGHVSRERVVSIHGLEELWYALALIDGHEAKRSDYQEIIAQAYFGNEQATRVIKIQTELFASIASDFALIAGARGGVYLSGSHIELLGDLFEPEVFINRFMNKGRALSYLKDIPVYQVITSNIKLIGLASIFE